MNRIMLLIASVTCLVACGPTEDPETTPPSATVESGVTVLQGADGTDFEGVELRIPDGALPEGTEVEVVLGDDDTPLPPTARAVGQQFELRPDDIEPSEPLEMTVPFRPNTVADDYGQTPTMVKVWLRRPDLDEDWKRLDQTTSTSDTVTVELDRGGALAAGVNVEDASGAE